ncbi:MAG TPA: BON domain-containing protein [Polyangiaceae bacterium]|nr:BON domain-containing protein [Polyangiaceae bacterium]
MKRAIIRLLPVCFIVACASDRRPADAPASGDAYTAASSPASAADTADTSDTSALGASDTQASGASSTAANTSSTTSNPSGPATTTTSSTSGSAAPAATGAAAPAVERRDGAVAADNTGVNERDRNAAKMTPGDQKENTSDLEITQKIRQAVMADDSLSFTAKNAKIITAGGRVTLRGVVKSDQERTSIAAAASKIVGAGNVDNQLEVKK